MALTLPSRQFQGNSVTIKMTSLKLLKIQGSTSAQYVIFTRLCPFLIISQFVFTFFYHVNLVHQMNGQQ